VKIERDAQELADSLGVKIFQADIIYHLFDKFTNYREELKQRKRDLRRRDVVGDLRTPEIFKRGPVWISVRIQLEGSDRDRRDGRGWNRQGRNAALRPEQGRELTLHFFFLSIPEPYRELHTPLHVVYIRIWTYRRVDR